MRNFWWQGIAMMEAAATRAVHGDPTRGRAAFLDVLDHWDRVGDATQQWLNLRYIARLLTRLDAESDAAALHDFLVAAGKPSPFDRPAARRGPPSAGRVEEPVAHARACLERLLACVK